MRRIILKWADVQRIPFKGSGPGGQHKNKTETCIRLIHEPTKLVAEGRSERSQKANEEFAWRLLQAKLDRMVETHQSAERSRAYQSKPDAAFGQQIRTYRLCGNDQITTDHRTGFAWPTDQVLKRGRLDGFLRASLRA